MTTLEELPHKVNEALGKPLTTETVREIWAEVKENIRKLDSCSYHEFEKLEPDNRLSDSRCLNCGGKVNSHEVRWYELGVVHGRFLAIKGDE